MARRNRCHRQSAVQHLSKGITWFPVVVSFLMVTWIVPLSASQRMVLAEGYTNYQ